jgi:flagellar biosynthesis protein FlhB
MNLQLFASQERTEPATQRKREEARRRGQVAKSMELISAVTLLTGFSVLTLAAPFMGETLLRYGRLLWEQAAVQDWSDSGVHQLVINLAVTTAIIVAPVALITLLAGLFANLLQVGFLFSLRPITPDFNRINPIAGAQRILSKRALADLAKSLAKIAIVVVVVYVAIKEDLDTFPALITLSPVQFTIAVGELIAKVVLRVGIAMLVVAFLDFVYQRWEYEQSLRMTKQEIKEELKQQEGHPEIRQRIRQKQREMARMRMMQDVKKADVVVTNPTHYAVALAYRQQEMEAPKVLAKGQGFVALRIREIAEEAGIPVVENPPVARQLYQLADVGQVIPADLYQTVAEILAFVYRLKQKGY